MTAMTRSLGTDLNWGRVIAFCVIFIGAALTLVEPAFAFSDFSSKVVGKTEEASTAATVILYAAAILALIIGVAPMLWGQVKVKWIVSCLVAAIVFGMIPTLISGITG